MLLTFVIFCICALAVLVILLALLYRGVKNPTTVPGLEPTDPKDGNLADIKKAGGFELFLDALHQEFGPVASFWYGQEFMVSVGQGSALKPLSGLFDRSASLFQMIIPLTGPNSLQFANGHQGKARWKAYSDSLSPANNSRKLPDLIAICKELSDVLADKAATDEHVDLNSYMTGLTIKMLSRTQLGSYFEDDDKVTRFYRQYESMNHTMVEILNGNPDSNDKWIKDIHEMHETLQDALKTFEIARESGDYQEAPLLSAIIENTNDAEDRPGEIGQTLADVITLVIGGYHTTAFALVWIIYHLAIHPDVQDKLVMEFVDVLGDEDDIDANSLAKLIYTRQVIDETLRLVRLAGFAARVADHEVRVGGHLVPAGIPILAALHVISYDEQVFPDPSRFDPDRFSPANSRGRGQLSVPLFGFGSRRCPGYNWAYAEIMVALSVIIRKFKVLPVNQVKQAHGFVTKPDQDVWIRLKKR